MTVQLAPTPVFRGVDAFGFPLYLGQLGTFVAGTNTPQATYKDSLGIATNTNPVILNPRGECNLWLDPAKAYKLVLSDAQGNLIWTVDNVTIGNANPSYNIIPVTDNLYNLGSPTFSWANVYAKTNVFVGSTLIPLIEAGTGNIGYYARTAAEIAASAVPVNFSYPPMYVDRYGTNTTPGTTSMTAAFQAAINTVKQGGGAIRWGRTAPYLLDATLNCTFNTSANQNGLYFDGSDAPVSSDGPGGGTNGPGIIAKHTIAGYVFDLTGCDAVSFNNMSIGSDAVLQPLVCFFMARANVAGNNSQIPRFNNVRVKGYFSKSLMYNYASEDGIYSGCYFANYSTTAGTKVVTITATNYLGLTSAFATIRTGSQSCTDHLFVGGQFLNASGDAASDVFYFDNCAGVKVYGAWMSCGSATTSGRAYFYVDTTNGAAGHIKLRDIVGEDAAHYAQYGVFFSNTAVTASDWAVQDCYLPNLTAAIASGALVVLDKFNVAQVTEQAGNGMLVSGNLQNSTINAGSSLPLTVTGTSTSNLIIGTVTAIGVRVKTTVIDTTTGNIQTNGNLGLLNNAPPAGIGGFGTPTGAAVVANYPGATATLVQTSNTVAEILTILKNIGFITA